MRIRFHDRPGPSGTAATTQSTSTRGLGSWCAVPVTAVPGQEMHAADRASHPDTRPDVRIGKSKKSKTEEGDSAAPSR